MIDRRRVDALSETHRARIPRPVPEGVTGCAWEGESATHSDCERENLARDGNV